MGIPFLDAALKIVDKLIPDPQAKQAAQLEVLKMQQAGEFKQLEVDVQVALGQLKVNEAEAASNSAFKGSWRPATGWVCLAGLAYTVIVQPLLTWGSAMKGVPAPPALDTNELMFLLTGMLGLSGMRSFEKTKKVA
jgi:hypothetical protein